ncbi:MAG TPA: hypothetical protein VGC22_10515 [Chitinophaga sp.]
MKQLYYLLTTTCNCLLWALATFARPVDTTTTPVNKAAITPWIAISNTDDKTIEVYNYNDPVWNSTTRNWLFKPTPALGFSAGAVTALGAGVGDMRLHYTSGFPGKAKTIMAIQGGRWLGIAAYSPLGSYRKGQKLWELTYPENEDPNDHAVELLPNGNLVVAGFGNGTQSPYGNWIRVYNTATPDTAQYAQVRLTGAHALYYDTHAQRLWAGGQVIINGKAHHGIFAYIIGGTRAQPTIVEDTSLRAVLPYGDPVGSPANALKWPHDITPDYDDYGKLIYADHTGVYLYNKQTKQFVATPGASHKFAYDGVDIPIKSAGKEAAGGYYVVTNVSDAPRHPYETNSVDFYDPVSGALVFQRFVKGYTIYRARIWTPVFE